jgi:hypothetical protein
MSEGAWSKKSGGAAQATPRVTSGVTRNASVSRSGCSTAITAMTGTTTVRAGRSASQEAPWMEWSASGRPPSAS